MTLHRWHEAECNGEIERREADDTPMRMWDAGKGERHGYDIPDRERGAKKRLVKIMAGYPQLSAYVQTDPRGCALYILTAADVGDSLDISANYSRGVAVHK